MVVSFSFLAESNIISLTSVPSFFFLHVCTACHMFSLLILTDFSFDHDLFLQHDVDKEATGLPPVIRCSAERMAENGVYLLGKLAVTLWK